MGNLLPIVEKELVLGEAVLLANGHVGLAANPGCLPVGVGRWRTVQATVPGLRGRAERTAHGLP